jgi:tRNA-Thr(GGU) m(6)t(6)A37 methyltransferase TsaA
MAGKQNLAPLRAIGHVETGTGTADESTIVIDPELAGGLQGLEPGDELMVVFYFDRSRDFELLQHPRGDRSRPKRGVFSLCSPRRPNPIGVTMVDLVEIRGNQLQVRGLDAFDSTPVLDLKPGAPWQRQRRGDSGRADADLCL